MRNPQPSSQTAPRPATVEELLALPNEQAAEIIDGLLVQKAAPSILHGQAQGWLLSVLLPAFHRRGGGAVPGGWWLAPEVEVELAPGQVYRPDIAGWRRERMPTLSSERPVRLRPDWVCEVLSRSNAHHDLVTKFRTYHRLGVPHYWTVDPETEVLTVYRWQEAGYLAVLTAARGETVRAEPFEAIAWNVGLLFGDEPE
ncbi:Uma2 family endonuclease [Archangium gephyra]|uniref:Uma2 family endonuclease n=1 Tax=Archangium gephyra TaxID=48 RepID=UPI0035D4D081